MVTTPNTIPAEASPAHPRRSLEGRLRFETLLADLSARFVNLPAAQVDSAIQDAQRRVCECLGLDASLLWQMSPDHPGSMFLTHHHLPPGFPPVPEVWDCKESFPWALGRFLKGEAVILSRLTDAPAEAARDVEIVRNFGVKSVVAIPLSIGGGTTFGALNFDVTREEREWPPELVTRLKLVALVFANALARKHDEQALRERKAQLLQTLEEVRRLRDRLEKENVYLRE